MYKYVNAARYYCWGNSTLIWILEKEIGVPSTTRKETPRASVLLYSLG